MKAQAIKDYSFLSVPPVRVLAKKKILRGKFASFPLARAAREHDGENFPNPLSFLKPQLPLRPSSL